MVQGLEVGATHIRPVVAPLQGRRRGHEKIGDCFRTFDLQSTFPQEFCKLCGVLPRRRWRPSLVGDLDGESRTHELGSEVTETGNEFRTQLRIQGCELVLRRDLAQALNLLAETGERGILMRPGLAARASS